MRSRRSAERCPRAGSGGGSGVPATAREGAWGMTGEVGPAARQMPISSYRGSLKPMFFLCASNSAIRVEDFGPPIGVLNGVTEADGAMIGQDDHTRIAAMWHHRVGERLV